MNDHFQLLPPLSLSKTARNNNNGRVVKVENSHVETYVVNAEGVEEESRFELFDKSFKNSKSKL